jgi:uncharacterized membrane protein YhaH (DUF805 family)
LNRFDGIELFFSSTGRIGRIAFLGCASLLLLLALGYRLAASDAVRTWTAPVVHGALLFSGACILSKRLHDRGRAGWWAFLVVFVLIGGVSSALSPRLIPSAAIMLWVIVDLGLWPGQRRDNRFGPRPGRN